MEILLLIVLLVMIKVNRDAIQQSQSDVKKSTQFISQLPREGDKSAQQLNNSWFSQFSSNKSKCLV